MDLAETLQRLYDTEIDITITMLPDGGFDFESYGPTTIPIFSRFPTRAAPNFRNSRR